jgi:hypothetical protein
MTSKPVSLRVPEELLSKLEADAIEGESLGGTIQRILSYHYGLALNESKVDHIQELVADEVERRTANLSAAYYDLKNDVETLQLELAKLQNKNTRRKPLTT